MKTKPKGPFGNLLYDALTRLRLGYAEAVGVLNKAGYNDGDRNETINRTTLTRWLTGTIPHLKTRRRLSNVLHIPWDEMETAVEATREWKLANTPTSSGIVPIHAALPARLAMSSSELVVASEWPVWFGLRLAHLVALVDNWQGPVAHPDALQALLHREILMFDAAAPDGPTQDVIHGLSRRQALVALAALPLAVATSGAGTLGATAATEFFLSRCAASLTACWHLLKGSDLATVDHLLSTYIVALEGIAQQRSAHQPSAARLAAQAHRICGIIALHRDQLRVRERHCQQAVYYAEVTSDLSGQVSALISLASTHFYDNNPAQAAVVYERALTHEASVPVLQRSRLHAELSVVYGQLQREREALRSIEQAGNLYPDHPDQDPSYLYAEFTPASLALEQGLAYVALAEHYGSRGYQRKATETFERIEQEEPSSVPDRIRFEIINQQAATAVLLKDLDAFEAYISQGAEGAALLGSKQRYKEMVVVYQRAIAAWPRDHRLKALGERIKPTTAHADEGSA